MDNQLKPRGEKETGVPNPNWGRRGGGPGKGVTVQSGDSSGEKERG